MNNNELNYVSSSLHKIQVLRRGAGLEQFYNMWRAATRDHEFLSTGYYFCKDVYPISARKDYGWVRRTEWLLWCWAGGEFWVHVNDKKETRI